MEKIFISRHKGAVSWAKSRLGDIHVIPHLDMNLVRPGTIVYGILPIHLVAKINEAGARYEQLVLDLTSELRGKELTPAEMEAVNARFEAYSALRVAPLEEAVEST